MSHSKEHIPCSPAVPLRSAYSTQYDAIVLALVLLGLLATSPDVLVRSEPQPSATVVARAIPRDAMRPFDQDKLGAAVFEIRGEWYHISIGTRKAWLRKTADMVFHPYLDLLTRRTPMLTERWDAKLYAELGRNPVASPRLKRALRDRRRIGVKILLRRMYKGELWFQIQTPAPDACADVPPNLRPKTGWIPAYDRDGEPYIWFSSVGC